MPPSIKFNTILKPTVCTKGVCLSSGSSHTVFLGSDFKFVGMREGLLTCELEECKVNNKVSNN